MYYVYILECSDGTLYTGWTVDLGRRLAEHNRGKGAKYTRSRFPVVLRYREEFASREEALRREYDLKKLSRPEKAALIKKAGPLPAVLAKDL